VPLIQTTTHRSLDCFDFQAYLHGLSDRYRDCPCLLCGAVHAVRVHAYLGRLVRCSDGENYEITIVSIICVEAKKQGRQYTKRMLPEFVIPECNIRLDLLLQAVAQCRRGGRLDYHEASIILGTVDDRTMRRHLKWLERIVERTVTELAVVLSQLPSFAELPQQRVGQSASAALPELVMELNRATVRMGGARGRTVQLIACLHVTFVHVRARAALRTPLDQVIRSLGFPDTS
jgi:hypothetical protein